MRRVLAVHFVPCALFVAGVLALMRAGSFAGRSDWGAVWPERPEDMAGVTAAVLVCASLLGLLLRPFQVRAVRVLEGYWDRWLFTAGLAAVLARLQRRRWRALREQTERTVRGETARRVQADARRRLAARPPLEVQLPTALGNALRAGELSAGERYGLTTLTSWPRLYLQVSDRMADILGSARNSLDTAVNLCWAFLALTAAGGAALYDEPFLWWWCGTTTALAAVAYKGAITAAQAYSGLMHVAYDLHRFDLLTALHHRLPPDPDSEEETFYRLSQLFAGAGEEDVLYDHGQGAAEGDDAG
ncbi:hypothetical protein [Streptomyces justiciae]|uniref:hypothetical protein n=1 Tax=Streptomyces justiciae TaxID=2780140 RepID=UPI0021194C35|nr:hypothetical protein [Streptomyces justiciae]MCW8377863.1 hypothetical protein [Streptomyces justiciae]